MAVKKYTLEVAELEDTFFTNQALIGIVSAFPAYRFCWLLNACFNLRLTRRPDLDIALQKEEKTAEEQVYFPIYQSSNDLTCTVHTLYRLRSEKEYLLPELPQIDYLWTLTSNDPETLAAQYTRWLKELPEVQLAQMITPHQLAHPSHLLW